MSLFASPAFLRRVLWADAASCLATGGLQLAALDALPTLLGLPSALLLDSGVFLVAYALVVGWLAMRDAPPRVAVGLLAIGNLGWAIGCAALLAGPWLQPTALGFAWVAAQAAVVLVLADLQWMGLRASARRRAGAALA